MTALLLAALPSAAAEPQAPYGECRAGYWTGNRNLDDTGGIAKATCFVNWKQTLADKVRMAAAVRAGRNDAGSADRTQLRVREAYVEAEREAWRVRLGRQIVAWGRADRINPTDSLGPRDYTLLAPEDEEQRLGVDALSLVRHLSGELDLALIAVPRFRPHGMPQGSLPANRRLDAPDDGEWALKLDKAGSGWDASLSYYNGFERQPRWFAQPVQGGLLFRGAYRTQRTLGVDAAAAFGAWNTRMEWASSRLAYDCAVCPAGRQTVHRAVIGVDRDLGENANLNLQLFGIRRNRYTSPAGQAAGALDRLNSEFAAIETGFSLRAHTRLLNDRLKLELGAVGDFTGDSYVLRPRLYYSVSDRWRLTAGLDHFHGRPQSYFGVRARNRVAFAEMALLF
ncbi:MAG TPA: DUF1302 family protein [Burkholderiaceae bacterium]